MRRLIQYIFWGIGGLIIGFLAMGCGYSEEEYMAQVKTAEKYQKEAKERQRQLTETSQELETSQQQNKKLQEQNQRLQKRPTQQELDDLKVQNEAIQAKAKKQKKEVQEVRIRAKAMAEELHQHRTREQYLEDELTQLEKGGGKMLLRDRQIFEELVARFSKEIRAQKMAVVEVNQQVVIRLKEHIVFDSGQAFIKASAFKLLNQIAEALRQIPDRDVRIEGHTDSSKIVSEVKEKFPTNWELSAGRAVTVVRYLVEVAKIKPDRIAASAYASYQPIAKGYKESAQKRNRRVEFTLIPSY